MGEEDLIDKDIDVSESFACAMLVYSKLTSITEARYIHFKSKHIYISKEAAKPLVCLKMLTCICFYNVNKS